MRRIRFTNLVATMLAVFALCGNSNAQEYAAQKLGARLIVESPSAIAGSKKFTYSSNPDMSGPWGAVLTPRVHEEVVRFSDSEACNTVTGVNGKWALIYRGNCEFGEKAWNAENAGAIGVIIWNHTPDELVNMAAGSFGASVTIPVLFVTKQDGEAINNQLIGGQQVFISISPWGFGKNHDLALLDGSVAASPGMAVPLYQLDGSDVPAYRGYTGALVANTGASTETNVKVKSMVSFTPSGSSTSTPFYEDSVVVASFPTTDSVKTITSPRSYKFTPTQTGVYNVQYTLTADDADEFAMDNTQEYNFAVTNDVFCRGRYDISADKPVITGYSRIATTDYPWTWGPLFYNKKGGYQLKQLKFALMDQDTSKHAFPTGYIDAYIFKWNDLNGDQYITYDELTLKGAAVNEFMGLDSPKKLMTVDIGNPFDGQPMTIISDDTSYYWVAFNLGTEFRLSVDANSNYYARAWAAKYATNPSFDFWGPGILKAKGDLVAGDTIKPISYGVTVPYSGIIDSVSFDQQYSVPAVALVTSMWPVSVANTNKVSERFTIYPNPATDVVYTKLTLDKPSNVYIKVMDALAREISVTRHTNVQNETIPVDVKSLAPGSYYIVLISDNKATVKPFVKN